MLLCRIHTQLLKLVGEGNALNPTDRVTYNSAFNPKEDRIRLKGVGVKEGDDA